MNLKQAEDVVDIYNEISYLKNVIDNLDESGVYTSEEIKYRQEAIKAIEKVLVFRVKQLDEY